MLDKWSRLSENWSRHSLYRSISNPQNSDIGCWFTNQIISHIWFKSKGNVRIFPLKDQSNKVVLLTGLWAFLPKPNQAMFYSRHNLIFEVLSYILYLKGATLTLHFVSEKKVLPFNDMPDLSFCRIDFNVEKPWIFYADEGFLCNNWHLTDFCNRILENDI